ncbi:hypothetical protein BH10BAC2_BH10BAC2_09860 [soil metagenome]
MKDGGSYFPAKIVMKIGASFLWLLKGCKGTIADIHNSTSTNKRFIVGYIIYLIVAIAIIVLLFF